MEESSRLFIKNLPPKISEAELRKHFSTGGREITDLKLIQPRRIAFVGYKTPEDARKAAKYFNKSYIKLSRLWVELAKPITDPSLPTARKIQHGGVKLPTPEPEANEVEKPELNTAKKRKRDALDEADPKLKEFLEVMRPGQVSSNKLEGIMDPVTAGESREAAALLPPEEESDDEYEDIPSRPLKRSKDESRDVPAPVPSPPPRAGPAAEEGSDAAPPPTVQAEARGQPQINATDDDWLRSRTNRLLDLVSPEEQAIMPRAEPAAPSTEEPGAATVEEEPQAADDSQKESEEQPAQPDSESSAVDLIRKTSRIFVRNLAYSTTEDDLRSYLETFGEIEEVHLPVGKAGESKGYALVQYSQADAAIAAFQSADGRIFQGRILHILPAAAKRESKLDEFAISKLPLKKQNLIRRKVEAATTSWNWNSLFMNQDAVNEAMAHRLGIAKSELLDPTSSDGAVKQAIAETSIIQETKAYFQAHGVDLQAFRGARKRGDTAILVKNIPFGTTIEELRRMFEEHGTVLQVLSPPSKTIAIVQFKNAADAKRAYAMLAYRRIKDSVLFLEKAPKDLFLSTDQHPTPVQQEQGHPPAAAPVQKASVAELLERDEDQEQVDTTTLFVRGLNFSTTTEKLADAFKLLDGFVSARVKTRTDPKRGVLSMGFGFCFFDTKEHAQAALETMNGRVLEGHTLTVKASHKGLDAAEERRREDKAKKAAGQRTKIVIKNLPFEATKKDVRALFGTYGQLRGVRIPKRFGNSSRGFAFAEFVTPREAENALKALRDTHLLGRRLVLDFAEAEAVDPEEELERLEKKMSKQVDKVALQQLTGRGRQKVNIGNDNEDEV
ncbi:Multiple RNA-binding domain-containing protein 1 [Pleurostoma richardsiae]|uniref:Multiple RNA-binding domain-containing protein 1 n=1 Tax=Pleurostoma richardsiae TaxID=41990 RepID=A0AA38VXL9_9PEZI|nr:Multiple RNA-binding domain-containing protein 1 [Pleurostoma richardsiae]